jgi:uncharacterized protein (TIGR02271 family)
MDLTGQLKRGMRIIGADRTEYGTVEGYDDENVYVDGRPVPYSAFERAEDDRLYVRQGGARYFGEGRAVRGMAPEAELRLPIVEERLEVDIRAIELGDVEVRRTVESERVSVPIVLRQDWIDVRHVDIEERPIAFGEGAYAFTGDTIRIPVRGEEVIIGKETVVTGEVAVGRRQVTDRRTVSESLRRTTVEVTGNDEVRNADRSFAEVEPEPRRPHGVAGADDGEPGDAVREQGRR